MATRFHFWPHWSESPPHLRLTALNSARQGSMTSSSAASELAFTVIGLAHTAYTDPLVNGFTLEGPITVTLTAREQAMQANAGLRVKLYRWTQATGREATPLAVADDGVELSTSDTEMTWSFTPPSTVFNEGDRLWVELFFAPIGTFGDAYGLFAWLGGPATGSYQSWIEITETIDWVVHPRLGTGANTLDAVTQDAYGLHTDFIGQSANSVEDVTCAGVGAVTETPPTYVYYFGAEASGTPIGAIRRVAMPASTLTTLAAVLGQTRSEAVAFSETLKAHIVTGRTGGGQPATTRDEFSYTAETISNQSYSASSNTWLSGAWSTDSYGYQFGGITVIGNSDKQDVYRFEFATSAFTTLAATHSITGPCSITAPTAGYRVGGYFTGSIWKFLFSTETFSYTGNAVASYTTSFTTEGVSFDNHGLAIKSFTNEAFSYSTETAYTASAGLLLPEPSRGAGSAENKGYVFNTNNALYTLDGATDTAQSTALSGGTVDQLYGVMTAVPPLPPPPPITGTGSNTTDAFTGTGTGVVHAPYPELLGTGANTLVVTSAATASLTWLGTGANDVDSFVSTGVAITPGVVGKSLYWCGHDANVQAFLTTRVWNFATRTGASGGTTLTTNIRYASGVQTTTNAYAIAGEFLHGVARTEALRYTYASTAHSSRTSALTTTRRNPIALTYKTTDRGFTLGGRATGTLVATNTIEAYAMQTEVASSVTDTLSAATLGGGGASTDSFGLIFAQGLGNSINKFTYATEARTLSSATIPVIASEGVAVLNSAYHAYCHISFYRSKISFVTDTDVGAATVNNANNSLTGPTSCAVEGGWVCLGNTEGSARHKRLIFGADVNYDEALRLGTEFRNNYTNNPYDIDYTFYGRRGFTIDDFTSAGVGEVETPVNRGAGYFAGGNAAGFSTTTIDKIDVSTEYVTAVGATLSVLRESGASFASSTNGYVAGGWSGGNSAGVDGLLFSNETAVNNAATLSLARTYVAAANSSTKGYVAGGYVSDTVDLIDAMTFVSDSAAAIAAVLVESRRNACGVQSATKGYFAGGVYLGLNTQQIDGILFATEAQINPSATLSVARQAAAGLSAVNYGYFCGGNSGVNTTEIDGLHFSTESAVNPSAVLATARYTQHGVSSFAKGFCGGGYDGTNSHDEVDGLNFYTETALNPTGALVALKFGTMGMSRREEVYLGEAATTLAAFTGTCSGLVGDPILNGTGANTTTATSAGEGTVNNGGEVTGTGANTFDAFTSAGTGVLLPVRTGTGENTTTSSSAGTGAVLVSGTSDTSPSVVSSGLGDVPVTGSAAATASASSAGVGTVSITGMGDSTFADFMQLATGGVSITGAFVPSTLEDAFVSSGSGYVTDFSPADHEAKLESLYALREQNPQSAMRQAETVTVLQ